MKLPIYLDNHATTRTDPRVVHAMLPYFTDDYGNAGSITHVFGDRAKEAVEGARARIAAALQAKPQEIFFTSGATESNNLALFGVAHRYAERGRHIISVATEHPSVLEPLEMLQKDGFEVTHLPVDQKEAKNAGQISLEKLTGAIRTDTILVSIMAANNEIGVVQPMREIGHLCRERGVLLHTDATQAVGKMPIDLEKLPVDLMSFSSHKIYGPKGVGGLFVRQKSPPVRLEPLLVGGGQETGLRSGTLNVPGIVGLAEALSICIEEMPVELERLYQLRNRLFHGLQNNLDGVHLNGLEIKDSTDKEMNRLPGNLNVRIDGVSGETLLTYLRDIAVSSGSACSSATPEPSHVLLALGLSEQEAQSSLRFGLGRFNTVEEVDFTVDLIAKTVKKLRGMIG